jgi:hypothetical protein
MGERDNALETLRQLKSAQDIEAAHGDADDTLCKFLRHLGYGDIVDAWEEVPKWYA